MLDFEFLRGLQNETVVKELSVTSAAASETFCINSPNKMANHGSLENCLNWSDIHIECKELHTVLTEAVADFANFYAYCVCKCTFLVGLTGRPIHRACPPTVSFNHKHWNTLPCLRSLRFSCATKTAHSLYDCLMYCLQKKNFAQHLPDKTRHSAEFVAAL